ncbi:MAG: hypothetical protein ACR2IF_08910 [Terriglobales bacterium]
MDNLQHLRDEYDVDGLGPLLTSLLAKIVWATVRLYPPSEYSEYGNWDKAACEDVLNDWIVERLWGRADLRSMLSSAPTTAQLRAALTTSLRQFLSNKRRRSIASNLYKRVRAQLRGAQFRSLSPDSLGMEQQQWTLKESSVSTPSILSTSDLVNVSWELNDEQLQVVKYGPFSQKLSPILREPKLKEFLGHLLGRAGGGITLGTILDVMRLRFGLITEENIEIDDSIPTENAGRSNLAEISVAARSIVSRLNRSQIAIVTAYFQTGGRFADAASRSGCEAQAVHETVHAVFEAVCECSETEDDARSIMNAVESLLTQRGD